MIVLAYRHMLPCTAYLLNTASESAKGNLVEKHLVTPLKILASAVTSMTEGFFRTAKLLILDNPKQLYNQEFRKSSKIIVSALRIGGAGAINSLALATVAILSFVASDQTKIFLRATERVKVLSLPTQAPNPTLKTNEEKKPELQKEIEEAKREIASFKEEFTEYQMLLVSLDETHILSELSKSIQRSLDFANCDLQLLDSINLIENKQFCLGRVLESLKEAKSEYENMLAIIETYLKEADDKKDLIAIIKTFDRKGS